MRVRGHQLHAAQAAPGERAQKLDPERPRLAVADGHAEHLTPAVGVDAHGDDDCARADVVLTPGFDVGAAEPDIGPPALDPVAVIWHHRLADPDPDTRHTA